jgi:hypothetical protein
VTVLDDTGSSFLSIFEVADGPRPGLSDDYSFFTGPQDLITAMGDTKHSDVIGLDKKNPICPKCIQNSSSGL